MLVRNTILPSHTLVRFRFAKKYLLARQHSSCNLQSYRRQILASHTPPPTRVQRSEACIKGFRSERPLFSSTSPNPNVKNILLNQRCSTGVRSYSSTTQVSRVRLFLSSILLFGGVVSQWLFAFIGDARTQIENFQRASVGFQDVDSSIFIQRTLEQPFFDRILQRIVGLTVFTNVACSLLTPRAPLKNVPVLWFSCTMVAYMRYFIGFGRTKWLHDQKRGFMVLVDDTDDLTNFFKLAQKQEYTERDIITVVPITIPLQKLLDNANERQLPRLPQKVDNLVPGYYGNSPMTERVRSGRQDQVNSKTDNNINGPETKIHWSLCTEDTVKNLKLRLRERGLPVHGTHKELAVRLYAASGIIDHKLEPLEAGDTIQFCDLDKSLKLPAALKISDQRETADQLNGYVGLVLSGPEQCLDKPQLKETSNLYDTYNVLFKYLDINQEVNIATVRVHRKNLNKTE